MDKNTVISHLARFYEKQTKVFPTAAFLQMHLLVERQMKEVLQQLAPNSEPIKNLTLKLEGRARVAYAFGLISEDLYEVLLFMDRIRNHLAHDLEYKITEQTSKQLFELARAGQYANGVGPWEERFYLALFVVQLEVWGLLNPGLTVGDVAIRIYEETGIDIGI